MFNPPRLGPPLVPLKLYYLLLLLLLVVVVVIRLVVSILVVVIACGHGRVAGIGPQPDPAT